MNLSTTHPKSFVPKIFKPVFVPYFVPSYNKFGIFEYGIKFGVKHRKYGNFWQSMMSNLFLDRDGNNLTAK